MRPIQSALIVLVFQLSVGAWAQTMPDAGALMRQSEQMFKQSQMQRTPPPRATLPAEMVINETTLITAQRVKFNGNQLLTEGQLQAVAVPFVNRPLKELDLQQLTHAVSEAYREAGWLVQAYIPNQSLTGGALTVQVIESIPPSKPAH